jgi:hypothetical protein
MHVSHYICFGLMEMIWFQYSIIPALPVTCINLYPYFSNLPLESVRFMLQILFLHFDYLFCSMDYECYIVNFHFLPPKL